MRLTRVCALIRANPAARSSFRPGAVWIQSARHHCWSACDRSGRTGRSGSTSTCPPMPHLVGSIAGVVVAEPSGTTPRERGSISSDSADSSSSFRTSGRRSRTAAMNGRFRIRFGPGRASCCCVTRTARSFCARRFQSTRFLYSLARVLRLTSKCRRKDRPRQTAVIRGRSRSRADRAHGHARRDERGAVGRKSPRQIVFRFRQPPSGRSIRFTVGGDVINRTLRALHVRLMASSAQLFRGQRAELNATVSSLSGGISEPVMLTIVNHSSASVPNRRHQSAHYHFARAGHTRCALRR